MKNLILGKIMLLFGLSLFAFSGCKKGKNDLGLTFRTRDARLVGDWTLSSSSNETVSTTEFSGKTTIITSTVKQDGGTETTSNSNGGTPSTSKYNLSLEIKKNGDITSTFEGFDSKGKSTGVTTVTGYWTWASTAKRKSSINMVTTGNMVTKLNGIWNIDQLKNKEIIFKQETYSKTTTSNSSQETVGKLTLTVVKNIIIGPTKIG